MKFIIITLLPFNGKPIQQFGLVKKYRSRAEKEGREGWVGSQTFCFVASGDLRPRHNPSNARSLRARKFSKNNHNQSTGLRETQQRRRRLQEERQRRNQLGNQRDRLRKQSFARVRRAAKPRGEWEETSRGLVASPPPPNLFHMQKQYRHQRRPKRNPCKAKLSPLAPCKNTTVLWRCYLNTSMYDASSAYLTSTFITRGRVSGRITRNIQRLNIPLFKTAIGQKTFYYRTVSTWNKLDSSLELCKNPASFTF